MKVRDVLFAVGVCCCVGCGGGAKTAARPVAIAPTRSPATVSKIASAVQYASEKDGHKKAIALLREALVVDPSSWEAHYDLGILLAQEGDLSAAEEQLRAAQKSAPENESVVIGLAEVRRRRGEDKQAADALAQFVEKHPEAFDARTLYLVVLREGGQLDRAMKEARDLLLKKPGDARLLCELSLGHMAKSELDAAELLVKEAMVGNKDNPIVHRTEGLLALSKGEDAQAFASFAKASQLDPKDVTARLNMGAVLLRAGAYAKAAEQYRAVLALTKDDDDAAIGMAAALRGEGGKDNPAKFAEAERLLLAVLGRDPHQVAALFNLGVLYADFMKKPADGKAQFKKFLADAPADHPGRAEAERQLAAK